MSLWFSVAENHRGYSNATTLLICNLKKIHCTSHHTREVILSPFAILAIAAK